MQTPIRASRVLLRATSRSPAVILSPAPTLKPQIRAYTAKKPNESERLVALESQNREILSSLEALKEGQAMIHKDLKAEIDDVDASFSRLEVRMDRILQGIEEEEALLREDEMAGVAERAVEKEMGGRCGMGRMRGHRGHGSGCRSNGRGGCAVHGHSAGGHCEVHEHPAGEHYKSHGHEGGGHCESHGSGVKEHTGLHEGGENETELRKGQGFNKIHIPKDAREFIR